jgi:hypothetical protein
MKLRNFYLIAGAIMLVIMTLSGCAANSAVTATEVEKKRSSLHQPHQR